MIFESLHLAGACVLKIEPVCDERGFFARSWCEHEAEQQGLHRHFVQSSLSFNRARGTLRGLHFQVRPHAEVKLVRCLRGEIFDVLVDMRPKSSTFGQWVGVALSEESLDALYIPEGIAHGFLTLTPDVLISYDISVPHQPQAARGVRWDDPSLAIDWPFRPEVVSARDLALPSLEKAKAALDDIESRM